MAAIVNYIDIISLISAKNYLKIDDDLTEDDLLIEQMINAAFIYLEKSTNHIFKTKTFTNHVNDGVIRIYNFPIQSVTTVILTETKANLHTTYCFAAQTPFIYVAGYADTTEVPDDLIQAALQIIKVWYYESEKQVNSTLIPISVQQVLDQYRRFL